MNRVFAIFVATIIAIVCVALPASSLQAGKEKLPPRPVMRRPLAEPGSLDLPLSMQPAAAASEVDTFLLVHYDFEQMNWQGWTRRDNTSPHGSLHEYAQLWHVEDFLEPEFAGRAAPLEGTKSMWCGALPAGNEFMCGWQSAPGYGNDWNQILSAYYIKRCSPFDVSFLLKMDIEDGKDFLYLDAEYFDGEFEEAARFTGQIDSNFTVTVPGAHYTKLRFRFETDDSGSDQDGLYTSYCSVTLDSIYMHSLGGELDHFEDFESYEDGEIYTGLWDSNYQIPYGSYAGLANNIVAKDPCGVNFGTQIMFFQGSSWPSTTYPGLFDTPHCYPWYDPAYPCQDEMVVSPPIDISRYSAAGDESQDTDIPVEDLPLLGGAQLRFTVYRDLPLNNLVFYQWKVRGITGGCPGEWQDRGFVYHGDEPEYFFSVEEIGDLIGSDTIQVGLGVVDMCKEFFEAREDCETHTPAPWFDNVSVVRYKNSGPQWHTEGLYLFQDNFPSTLDIESPVRADMAMDIRPAGDPVIQPGDSIVVTCASPMGGGIAEDAFGPRVYMHVKCSDISLYHYPPKPDLAGSQIEGSYGHYISDDGTWTIIQADPARIGSGSPAPDRYAFDLNDSLFTRGYMIEYYFKAYDNLGLFSTSPVNAETVGEYPYEKGSHLYEFTCLPFVNGQVLYVDDYDGIGTREGLAQTYLDNSFDDIFYNDDYPDRYDVNSPEALCSNGLGSRAKVQHLLAWYRGIIWDSGDLRTGTITTTATPVDKSNDGQLLLDWLDAVQLGQPGLLVMGDGIAAELDALGLVGSELLEDYCGVTLVADSYFEMTGGIDGGGIANPFITGIPLSVLDHMDFPLFGGCPYIRDFDVLEKTVSGSYMLAFPDYSDSPYYAGIGNTFVNSVGETIHTAWFGFSFMNIRNPEGQPCRNELLHNVLRYWMQVKGAVDDFTGDDIPAAYSLSQNYPNPFNPSTTISFALKAKGRVRLRVYDVAGRLVTTLVDEMRDAGHYDEVWTGRNDRGSRVASGVYFLRMESGEFESTKKIVLLR